MVAMMSCVIAHADPAPIDALHSPAFATLERYDASSRFGGELSFLTPFPGERADLHVQYVDPKTGMGAYASLPFAYSAGRGGLAIGDAEVGGISAPHLRTDIFGLVFHAGITVPIGSTSAAGAGTNLLASPSRLDDRYLAIPAATSLRGGISALVRGGPLFGRADVGLDANLSDEQPVSGTQRATGETAIRINAGAGIDLEYASVTAELASFHAFGVKGWLDTVAVALRFKVRRVQPYAAVVFQAFDTTAGALTIGIDASI
ncbi:MAG: hypothetical protein JWO36_6125 [Myxococcales bacterium]|nr:hypothetical protein [Myxococcales bacterium]